MQICFFVHESLTHRLHSSDFKCIILYMNEPHFMRTHKSVVCVPRKYVSA